MLMGFNDALLRPPHHSTSDSIPFDSAAAACHHYPRSLQSQAVGPELFVTPRRDASGLDEVLNTRPATRRHAALHRTRDGIDQTAQLVHKSVSSCHWRS